MGRNGRGARPDPGTSGRRGDHGHRLAAAPRRHDDTHARDRARHPRDAANGADVAHGLARPAAAIPRQRTVAVGQHLHERRRLASRQLARHRHESNADAAQRPAVGPGTASRHPRRRHPADGADPARRGRDRRRFRGLRLGCHQRRRELHPRHRVRGSQSQHPNRHDGPARSQPLSGGVRGRRADRRTGPPHRLRRLLRRGRHHRLRRARLGRRRLGAVHANQPHRILAALLRAGRALASHHARWVDSVGSALAGRRGRHHAFRRRRAPATRRRQPDRRHGASRRRRRRFEPGHGRDCARPTSGTAYSSTTSTTLPTTRPGTSRSCKACTRTRRCPRRRAWRRAGE